MEEFVLLVDDNHNLLEGLQRQLRKRFNTEVATSGAQALELIQAGREFSIVVSDMRMPEMDGIEFLKNLQELVPDTVRIMLTGNADQTTVVQAVNEGNVFRFLNKPVQLPDLENALYSGLELYRLRQSEKELLNDTLKGVTGILSELISFVDPMMFDAVSSVRSNIKEVSKQLNVQDSWELEMAALLSRVGELALPPELRSKIHKGEPLTDSEREIYQQHPESAYSFLSGIPRLGRVANLVRGPIKEEGSPEDEDTHLKHLIIRLLNTIEERSRGGEKHEETLAQLESSADELEQEAIEAIRAAWPVALGASENTPSAEAESTAEPKSCALNFSEPFEVSIAELEAGQIVLSDIRALNGALLLRAGNAVTDVNLARINNYHRFTGVSEPVVVVTRNDYASSE